MSLIYTPEEEAFRAEVRTFLQNEYPEDVKEVIRKGKRPSREQTIAGQKALAKGGYAATRWPVA